MERRITYANVVLKGLRMRFSRKRMIFTALKEVVGNAKSEENLLQGQRDNYCWQL